MPEFYLKQPELLIVLVNHLKTSWKNSIQKLNNLVIFYINLSNLKHLQGNELNKACFTHDAAYSQGKDLVKRSISTKILKARAYEIAKNCGYDGYKVH